MAAAINVSNYHCFDYPKWENLQSKSILQLRQVIKIRQVKCKRPFRQPAALTKTFLPMLECLELWNARLKSRTAEWKGLHRGDMGAAGHRTNPALNYFSHTSTGWPHSLIHDKRVYNFVRTFTKDKKKWRPPWWAKMSQTTPAIVIDCHSIGGQKGLNTIGS